MRSGIIKIIVAVSAVIAVACFLKRDLYLESVYTYDFKNRQVGSRIQKDGGLPYFYIWKEGEPQRYYDFYTNTNYSIITATPFTHYLLFPIADLNHRNASLIWLMAEYAMLFICILIAAGIAKSSAQYIVIAISSVLFLCTIAWKLHISAGQNYIPVPALFTIFLWFLSQKQNLLNAFLAGLSAIVVLLIRPNAIFFFIPFFFLISRLRFSYISALLLPSIVAALFIVFDKNEWALWKNYHQGMMKQLEYHKKPEELFVRLDSIHRFAGSDGWDSAKVQNDSRHLQINKFSENGNFFVIAEKITGVRPSGNVLTLLLALATAGIVTLVYFREFRTEAKFSLIHLYLAGTCLYMISDLLSPVFRHQYYTVQWLGGILVAAAIYSEKNRLWVHIMLLGLFLNIVNISWLKMEHTLGEYIVLFSLLMIAFKPKTSLSK